MVFTLHKYVHAIYKQKNKHWILFECFEAKSSVIENFIQMEKILFSVVVLIKMTW